MAEKHSDALQKLEEQLTCPICFDHLTNPKTLSCLHSFCHKCLEQLTSFSNEVKCPSCRSSFDLGESGVDSLPTAFLVNNLMEVHGMLKKVSSDTIVVCDICGESFASGYCQQCESFSCEKCLGFHKKWKKNATHSILTLQELAESAYDLPRAKSEVVMKCTGHNKPLDIYCETCEELICQHCTVRIHRDHSYDVVHDIYDTQREAIKTSIVPVDELISEGESCTKALLAKKELLAEKGDKVKKDIQTRTSRIMDQLFVAADKLSREVDTAIIEEDSRIDEQIGEIKASLCQLSACKEYIEQSLSVGSPQQVLSSKTKLIKHTEGVVKACDFSKFQEAEDFMIGLDRGIEMRQSAILKNIGKINSKLVTPIRTKGRRLNQNGWHDLSLQEDYNLQTKRHDLSLQEDYNLQTKQHNPSLQEDYNFQERKANCSHQIAQEDNDPSIGIGSQIALENNMSQQDELVVEIDANHDIDSKQEPNVLPESEPPSKCE